MTKKRIGCRIGPYPDFHKPDNEVERINRIAGISLEQFLSHRNTSKCVRNCRLVTVIM